MTQIKVIKEMENEIVNLIKVFDSKEKNITVFKELWNERNMCGIHPDHPNSKYCQENIRIYYKAALLHLPNNPVGSIFALFFMYFTQPKLVDKIPITLHEQSLMIDNYNYNQDAKKCIQWLFYKKAFIVVAETIEKKLDLTEIKTLETEYESEYKKSFIL